MGEKGILYGVGVGPGDPELLTLKARRILSKADVLAIPERGAGEHTALAIIGDLAEGKERLYCSTPMIRDRARLAAAHDKVASDVAGLLEQGKTVAFITLGDPAVYSTYMYIHRRVAAMGYEARVVPGVTSFCAAAAELGRPLCEGSERLLIVPASHKDVSDCMAVDANLVFMKAGKELGRLREKLEEADLLESASLVENCGMEDERIYPGFAGAPEDSGYFSVVLVRRKKH